MLLVVAALGLDRRQRVEAADRVEHRVLREGLQHDQVDPRARRLEHVVLAVDQHRERVAAAVDPALEPLGRALEQVLVAPAEEVELGLAREQVAGVGQLAQRRALGQHAQRLPGHELRQPERVELPERVAVVGQQVLGRELQQDRVVALEGREDVGVGLQRGEAARAQVARAAARLAAALDRLAGVPGGDRLHARGQRLELAPRALVVGRERGVELVHQPLLRERERVRLRQRGQQPPLVRAVVQQQRLRSRPAGRTAAAPTPRRTAIVSATFDALRSRRRSPRSAPGSASRAS